MCMWGKGSEETPRRDSGLMGRGTMAPPLHSPDNSVEGEGKVVIPFNYGCRTVVKGVPLGWVLSLGISTKHSST
jgi:hypothetical protein